MSRYTRFAAGHPHLLAALVVVLFLPWLWMASLVPFWALAISLALVPLAAMLALALVIKDVDAAAVEQSENIALASHCMR